MLNQFSLDQDRLRLIKFWLPALASGLLVWLFLLIPGDTPVIRASGLALVIVGVTAALRRMGSALAVIGALSLALSPVFWSQTGGGEGEPATIVLAIGAAALTVIAVVVLSKRPYIAIGLGVLVFAGLFWSQLGTERSIRLTALVIAWVMYLLIDMLLLTNPRPDEAPMILREGRLKTTDGALPARSYHTWGLLLLLGVGILNDPLLTLLMPSLAISLLMTQTRLTYGYWAIFGVVALAGLYGLWDTYIMHQLHWLVFDQWRSGERWLAMVQLVVGQFTILGVIFGVLGLARLARWYPPLGTVTMIAYAAYWFFGLVYTGPRRELLLLPLFVIQVLWMTYAVLALSEWVGRSTEPHPQLGRWAVFAGYALLPISMLVTIISTG